VLLTSCLLCIIGCGDGGTSPDGSGSVGFRAYWQQDGSPSGSGAQDECDGFNSSTNIPPDVATVRIVFKSTNPSGEGTARCCLALRAGDGGFTNRRVVLDELRAGGATLRISGFEGYPVPDDDTNGVLCPTDRTDAQPCGGGNPPLGYDSGQVGVTIVAAQRTDVERICVRRLAAPTSTPSPSATLTFTATPTNTAVATHTSTATQTPTSTPQVSATFTHTPTATDTATATATHTATPTSSHTETPTATPTFTPSDLTLRVGSASGRPGERVSFSVIVSIPPGKQAIATLNEVSFDLNAQIAETTTGSPDCSSSTLSFSSGFLRVAGCVSFEDCQCVVGETCTAISASTDTDQPIADGTVAYTCSVDISPQALPGTRFPLPCSGGKYHDPVPDEDFPAACTGGEIEVLP
jgi:hypothetical protein